MDALRVKVSSEQRDEREIIRENISALRATPMPGLEEEGGTNGGKDSADD